MELHQSNTTSRKGKHLSHSERIVFDHWEIDLVAGGKEILMTLTERKIRLVRIPKLKDRTQASVLKALGSIESVMGSRAFRAVFKSGT